jgi:hypothetical protein
MPFWGDWGFCDLVDLGFTSGFFWWVNFFIHCEPEPEVETERVDLFLLLGCGSGFLAVREGEGAACE